MSADKPKSVTCVVTPSITCQIDELLDTRWKAACPICVDAGRKQWKKYATTRTEAERLLHNHLGTHNTEQGAMF